MRRGPADVALRAFGQCLLLTVFGLELDPDRLQQRRGQQAPGARNHGAVAQTRRNAFGVNLYMRLGHAVRGACSAPGPPPQTLPSRSGRRYPQ